MSDSPTLNAPHATPAIDAPAVAEGGISIFDQPLAPLRWSDPFRWLAAGWRDFLRCPVLGLFYGACFAAMGGLLMSVFEHAPAYTLALSAGFLLVGPLMCLGLYQASRDLEMHGQPDLGRSLLAWEPKIKNIAIFGAVLLVLEMIWGRASLIVFALSFDGMPDFKGSLHKLLEPENIEFIVAYLAVGSIFAGWIFAVSVISMPMLLDRDVDAVSAGLVSVRLVMNQPGVMLLWGGLIALLVTAALLPWFLGLLVVGPVLGHATWHAYRAAVPRSSD